MPSAKSGYPNYIEIDAGDVDALTFTANGEYLVSGGPGGVQVWRVKDGERVATMKMKDVWCVAVSKDGRFIAGGFGGKFVWDSAANYEQVFALDIDGVIYDVDFSPDSTRLVCASYTATIWDVAAQERVQTLDHGVSIYTAKYSPKGDRIATASFESIRVWDSDNGHLLVDTKVGVKPRRGLLWFNNHLLVKTKDSKIKQIDGFTGLAIAEWPVPHEDTSCVALPHHANFVAYATKENITFWDTSTHAQVGLISQGNDGDPITAFSPDDQLLAIVSTQKIIVKDHILIKDPDIRIESTALNAWKGGQLTDAEALLTAAIPTSKDTAYHVLASRALVRARLGQWDAALADAEESLEIQPSVFGYIAKFVVLVGKGETLKGCRTCDIAFQLHSDHVSLFLLIKAVVLFMAGEHEDGISRIDDLIAALRVDSILYVVQSYMYFVLGNLHMENGDYERAIQMFEDAQVRLGGYAYLPPLIVSLISGWKFDHLTLMIQQRLCEALVSAGRTSEAGKAVLHMVCRVINVTESIKMWISEFMEYCLSTPENIVGFTLPTSAIYQFICGRLEVTGQVADAVTCFHQICNTLGHELDGEQTDWNQNFKSRCCKKLEDLGDNAMNALQYDEAISQYTLALSVNPTIPQELLVKRSNAYASKAEWGDALKDANQAIELDPSSLFGHEKKYTALHGMGRHDDAILAFETMLLKMSESSDPEIRGRSRHYVNPEKTKKMIRTTIEDTIRDSPLVLINTASGRLYNKSEQASAFEATPTFTELILSMTTHLDSVRIQHEVGGYYRYAMFSHKWEANEPLFEKVIKIMVYDLEASPTHEKLKMFCKIVREAGFNWAWSDTCCINKGDHFVLQEALVSMFKWYERSAMTVIYLLGVDHRALRGALTRSIWNMRAWTLQEYHASKVVRIYTEDWTPYLGLTIGNHKESPEVVSEMEEATGISAQALMALRPGLDDIREKLRLASTRQTTRVEDAAYSLLGIFSISLPITYGEGDQALGRLLAQLLTSSGNTSILAWTGTSGSFNSCLPTNIIVFNQLPTTHVPPAILGAEMGSRSLNIAMMTKLYDRVNELAVPSFSGYRLKLPCLAFKLGPLSVSQIGSGWVFRAQTNALGAVEIQTKEDLSQLGSLTLVHPWIDFLLDRQPVRGSATETIPKENMDDNSSVTSTVRPTRVAWVMSRIGLPLGGRSALGGSSLRLPSAVSTDEKRRRVLQFIARLQRPFGALLLTPTRRNVEEYRRVAADSLITVKVEKITSGILEKLTQDVCMLDVL